MTFRCIVFCLILGLLSLTSCGGSEDTKLEIEFPVSKNGIIGGSGFNCYDIKSGATDGSVGAYRIFYPTMKIKWGVNEDFFITSFKIKWRGSNVDNFTCQFEDTEIASLFGASMKVSKNSALDENGAATANTVDLPAVLTSDTACRIWCGGINLKDDSKGASLNGTAVLEGYYVDSDSGEASTVRAQTTLTATFTP